MSDEDQERHQDVGGAYVGRQGETVVLTIAGDSGQSLEVSLTPAQARALGETLLTQAGQEIR